jgi:cyanophycinase
MKSIESIFLALCLALFLALAFASPASAAKSYSYFRVGSPTDVATSTTPGTVLMGGGTDVDAAFQWMCARSGGGDFLVIRATGTDAYNPYIQQLCPNENSVATLIIPNRAEASDPFVISTIQSAEALWIAGGDQSNYINFWKGTPVQDAVNALIARGVPVGGTSAGMNVLTQFVYSALASQGVTSSQALADPFTRYITLDRDFANISNLTGIIGDPHFVTRDRMGRDLAFLCRIYLNGWSSAPRGISIDEQTALLIDGGGKATVVGSSTVYFLQASGGPQVCQAKTPLTYQNIGVYRIDSTGSFSLSTWKGSGGITYTVSANAGVLSSAQSGGAIY